MYVCTNNMISLTHPLVMTFNNEIAQSTQITKVATATAAGARIFVRTILDSCAHRRRIYPPCTLGAVYHV